MATPLASKRLGKELKDLQKPLPGGVEVVTAEDFDTWWLSIQVLGNKIYEGKKYLLRFTFTGQNFPIEPPIVFFHVGDYKGVKYEAPVHPHIYTNGHICLDALGSAWSPVLSVISVCISVQSMLASNTTNQRPPDNDRYVKKAPWNPKETRFHYHDDTV